MLGAMRSLVVAAVAAVVAVGCSAPDHDVPQSESIPPPPIPSGQAQTPVAAPPPPEPGSDRALAQYLPTINDLGDLSWVLSQYVGTREPWADQPGTGCDNLPFDNEEDVAATATATAMVNGPVGSSHVATVRILRQTSAPDIVAATEAWAQQCPEFSIGTAPHSVVALAAETTDHDVTLHRFLLTDLRQDRFQTEGSPEWVLMLAQVGDLVVYGLGHDRGEVAKELVERTVYNVKLR